MNSKTARAFTLIEVMVAVLILALLTSLAAMSFRRPLDEARATDAASAIRAFDATCRDAARRFNRPVTMTFDCSASTLTRSQDAPNGATVTTKLPPGCHLREVRTAGHRTADGSLDVPCSPLGVTRTYAVRVAGAGFDYWLLAPGLGSEVKRITDVAQLDAIFAATATQRESATGLPDDDSNAPPPPPGDDAR